MKKKKDSSTSHNEAEVLEDRLGTAIYPVLSAQHSVGAQ